MVRAFGYCNDPFDTLNPGRLCRGRERWIEGLPDAERQLLHRTVVSGAVFSDDSARDAQRGFRFSGVSSVDLLMSLFPDARVLGFSESGDPRALPNKTLLEEDWTRARFGGATTTPVVRWIAEPEGEEGDAWLAGEYAGVACPQADGFIIGPTTKKYGVLSDALYRLTGFADADDRPSRLYCPTGVSDVLAVARAVVLLHLDKHGPVLAIYSRAPLDADGILDRAAHDAGAFPVPFAIPPMLARWDRALYELRQDWDPDRDGEFPVPPADDAGGRWSARRRRREDPETPAAETVEE